MPVGQRCLAPFAIELPKWLFTVISPASKGHVHAPSALATTIDAANPGATAVTVQCVLAMRRWERYMERSLCHLGMIN
jgi:hypothetical protein